MPNIRQIISLREKYAPSIQKVSDSFDVALTKGYIERSELSKAFVFENFDTAKIRQFSVTKDKQTPEIIKYFDEKKKIVITLLFIDITNFSIKTEKLSVESISARLNDYYDKLIPIIYKHSGEIEKIMGDGIICIFGEPFFYNKDYKQKYYKAEACAREVINKFKGTANEVKIALHSGQIMYYKTPSEHYEEYTMIGKPLTELYRLESIAISNGINYFKDSAYDKITDKLPLGVNINNPNYWEYGCENICLKGVNYNMLRYLKRK